MTMSGTEVFFLYILFYPIARKYFSIRWRYFVLKVSLVFYLIPFAWFKFIALAQIYKIFPRLKIYFVNGIKHIDLAKYIYVTQEFNVVSWQIKIIRLIVCLIGTMSAVLIFIQLRGYYKLKKACAGQNASIRNCDMDIFQDSKTALGVKKEVNLVFSEFFDTPFTIGAFHPTIVMPTFEALSSSDLQYIINHELNHIKNNDIFYKFMALFAVAINWYNPFCYFMYRELCSMSEIYCDYCTMKELGLEERRRYCNLILDVAAEDNKKINKKYVASLVNSDSKIIERRIVELKKYGGPRRILLSCLVGGVICIAGSVTSFAYNPPTIYYTVGTDINTEVVFQDIALELEALPYDYFWTDVEGNISELKASDPKAYCPHEYEPGTVTKHTRYSDNSCKVVYLNAKKCILCDRVVDGSVINTVHYDVCPH